MIDNGERDYQFEADILRRHAIRCQKVLIWLYGRADCDTGLMTTNQKQQLANLMDESAAAIDFTQPEESGEAGRAAIDEIRQIVEFG